MTKYQTAPLRAGRIDRGSLLLLELCVLLPLLAVLVPLAPVRLLASAGMLLVLPGLASVRLMRLGDRVLGVLVSVVGSLALSVAVSTVLMYAGVWSWQLTLGLLGLCGAGLAALGAVGGGAR